jgi:putative ABC transport system substrate-binding protein
MNRREAVLALLAFGASPFAAKAQQAGKVYRIGFLRPSQLPKPFLEAFQQGLRERGYIDGQNAVIEYRLGTAASTEEVSRLAGELVNLNVDVIVASTTAAALAAKEATATVPIVFVAAADPVEMGLVLGLAHPGGNVTGLCFLFNDLAGKRMQMLLELIPNLRRIAVIWHRANPGYPIHLKAVEAAARIVGVQIQSLLVDDINEFESAFKAAHAVGALYVPEAALFTTHRKRLAELEVKYRLPAIYGVGEHVRAGGLISYGADFLDMYKRAATHIDKILRGAKPRDLPVEQPTKFDLLINLKTAKAIGIKIPQSLLLRATEVIE